MSSTLARAPRPMWLVSIAEHRAGRHDVPATVVRLGSPSEQLARLMALEMHHATHGVPRLRRFIRQAWPSTSVAPAPALEGEREY